MQPLCHIPWTNIDIAPRGNIQPCCKYEVPNSEVMNITTNTIQDYVQSENLQKIKQKMLDNQWPKGCIRCKTEEKSGIKSKRLLDYERWQEAYDKYTEDQGFITASIAFGNTCNLKCITCNPGPSSRWRKEYRDLYGIDKPPVEVINNMTSDDIYRALPNAIHMDIPGGEPFLSEVDKQLELLNRYVDSGQSKHMTLHYTTNTQVYPDSKWWSLWENFKEIDIQLSIDGVGNRYEYIRYPAKNTVLLENVDRYLEQQNIHNIRLSVSHTVSAYNIYYLDEFFTWCSDVGLPKPWCGRAHNPSHMRPCVYTDPVRTSIAKYLDTSKHDDVKTWGKYMKTNNSSEHYERFLTMRDKHDVYRNTNFAKTFPEVEELINGF